MTREVMRLKIAIISALLVIVSTTVCTAGRFQLVTGQCWDPVDEVNKGKIMRIDTETGEVIEWKCVKWFDGKGTIEGWTTMMSSLHEAATNRVVIDQVLELHIGGESNSSSETTP